VANDIRELRNLAGWSQFQVASATGIDRTRLSLIENNHVAPTTDEQVAIEQALLGEIGRRKEQLSAVLTGAKE
jgi:transcriptional regulator with XRE-family HTH domain